MNGLPAALVLVTLILSSTFLTWKGIIPSHAFFMVAGAAITWVVPKVGQIFSPGARARVSDAFPAEEVPTNPSGRAAEKDKKT